MKKLLKIKDIKGFTLAEVMIAVAVIGIVAAVSIPLLTSYIDNIRYKSALKRNYAAIVNAFQRTYTLDFNKYSYWLEDYPDSAHEEAYYDMGTNMILLKDCGRKPGCWTKTTSEDGGEFSSDNGLSSSSYSFIIANGASVSIDIWDTAKIRSEAEVSFGLPDIGKSLVFAVDTNGPAKPNYIGKDVHLFIVTTKGIYPAGSDNLGLNCIGNGNDTGWSCSAKWLYEDKNN